MLIIQRISQSTILRQCISQENTEKQRDSMHNTEKWLMFRNGKKLINSNIYLILIKD